MTKGRPRLSTEDKRNERIIVCLSPAEKRAIDGAAQGRSAVWAREVLLAAAAATVKPQPPDGDAAGFRGAEPGDEGGHVP